VRILLALIAMFTLASCGRWDVGVEIPIVATWQGQPIGCNGDGPVLSDLRFYLSNPQLIDKKGKVRDLRFATEFEWQNDAVAFIDLEDGSGACANGTTETFDRVIGVARAREYRGLRFTIGVPFRLNHENPLTATPPLDDSAMHWHWRSGYKFLRAGVQTENDGFWIHAGSAGCEGTVGHITGCRYPNRIDVELPDFVPGESAVEIDLAELLAGTDLGDGEASDCSSGPPEIACVAPYAALGIDFATGEGNGAQRVIAAR
jgi:uncharacterized repeat protein (TIGR04052 family)